MINFKDLLEEAKKELEDEKKIEAKEKIKSRLREIEEAENVLQKLKKQFEKLLEEFL